MAGTFFGVCDSAGTVGRARMSPVAHRQEPLFLQRWEASSCTRVQCSIGDRRHLFARLVPSACMVKDSPRELASRDADSGMYCSGDLRHGRSLLKRSLLFCKGARKSRHRDEIIASFGSSPIHSADFKIALLRGTQSRSCFSNWPVTTIDLPISRFSGTSSGAESQNGLAIDFPSEPES